MDQVVSGSVNWTEMLEEFRSSKLSQAEFCRQRNISYSNFNVRLRRLTKSSPVEKSGDFTPVEISSKRSEPNGEILLILPNGVRCQIRERINETGLQKIIKALLAC